MTPDTAFQIVMNSAAIIGLCLSILALGLLCATQPGR